MRGAVIPPEQNTSRHVDVLLSVDNTIIVVDNLESADRRISRGPFRSLAEFDTQTNNLALLVGPSGDTLRLMAFVSLVGTCV
ncbi:hypothetical protein EDD15DRAFT_2277116, partial [Pisolithus albus]